MVFQPTLTQQYSFNGFPLWCLVVIWADIVIWAKEMKTTWNHVPSFITKSDILRQNFAKGLFWLLNTYSYLQQKSCVVAHRLTITAFGYKRIKDIHVVQSMNIVELIWKTVWVFIYSVVYCTVCVCVLYEFCITTVTFF